MFSSKYMFCFCKETQSGYEKILDDAYASAKERTEIRLRDWLDSPWKSMMLGCFVLQFPISVFAVCRFN